MATLKFALEATMRRFLLLLALACAASQWMAGASLRVPDRVQAGQELSIPTSGSGEATLYLFGPSHVAKRTVKLGAPVTLAGDELASAGRYVVVLNGESSAFFVTAGPVSTVAFIARPSRVPASTKDVVSGTVFLFDRNQNLVLSPEPVSFSLAVPGAPDVRSTQTSKGGVAWTRLDSSRRAGAAQFVASAGAASVRRVVQEVASEPCNIRMHAERAKDGAIALQTDPIRDCAGNPVPDGTIVTFTSVDENGRSTVDARIKRGIAQAELPASQQATISVAAGVVIGNEIRWGGKQ
ncbi:MAG: hypothetical protein ABR866_01640 [Candidatus Korobacteraceae bacterium]|jgi:hypothetical protein